MKENEAIPRLMFLKEKLYNGIYADRLDCIDYAISALKEIQQYRKIGASPERITELILEGSAAKRILGHYQKIGTLQQCREAMERQKAFCESAEKYADGKCIGYGKSEMDDEPLEMCKRCKSYVGFEESEDK